MSESATNEAARLRRAPRIPHEYIYALADKIHKTQPTMDVLVKTLTDFYTTVFPKAYGKAMADNKHFRDARKRTLKKDFDLVRDTIDDMIHSNQSGK